MELSEIRTRIDAVDDQLLKLFLERMELAEEVAAYKNEHHLPILNKQREREILAKVTARAGDKERYAYHLYSTLFELARSRQAELVDLPTRVAERVEKSLAAGGPVFPQTGLVACQGVEGAYSQIACEKIFKNPFIMYFKSFEAVFSAIDQGLCQYGILPIENSPAGSVNKVYDLMIEHNFSIVRTFRLKIDHNLLVNPGTNLADIKEVYSHEQAINQCGNFLHSLPGVNVIPVDNTALAAQMVAQSGRKDVAARRAVRTGLSALLRAGQGQQPHPLHLHQPEPGNLPRLRQDLHHDGSEPQARRALQGAGAALHAGHQRHEAGIPPHSRPGI